MKPFFALAVVIFPAVAWCQQHPSLDVLLDRLDAYAKRYQATLPSLVCEEQITSQALNNKGKVTWEMKIQSTLREVRTEDTSDPFREEREYKRVNGRRARRVFQTPYFVEGGFAGLVGSRAGSRGSALTTLLPPATTPRPSDST